MAIGSEFLFALLGSSLFWLTLAGISVRALKIDFQSLEEHLKLFYFQAEQWNFSVRRTADLVIEKILCSLYGRTSSRQFLATLLACLITSLYIFSQFIADWRENQHMIDTAIQQAVETVDREYFHLVSSEDGRKRVDFALQQAPASAEGGYFYVHNDKVSQELRTLFERFRRRYETYIAEHALVYFDALDRYFGHAYSDPHWHNQKFALIVFGLIWTILGDAVIDYLALRGTFAFYHAVKWKRKTQALADIVLILFCFSLSGVSYITVLHGHEATLFQIVVPPVALLWVYAFPIVIFLSIERKVLRRAVLLGFLMCVIFGISSVGLANVLTPWILLYEKYRNILSIVAHGLHRESILIGMLSLYPLILILSLFVTVCISKVCFFLIKHVFLGQVYGASVLSGGTFFFGFLTTVISSTTVAYSLMKVLLH